MNGRLLSGIIAAALLASPLSGLAADFDIGQKYEQAEDQAAKAETERLYQNRPSMLRQAEDLGRGVLAVPSGGAMLVSWRFLGTDKESTTFDLYRNGEKIASALSLTNYLDAQGKAGDTYEVRDSEGGSGSAKAWDKEYFSIPVVQYDKGDYIVDDASVGDLDGDGEYEFIVRRTPADYFNKLNVDESGKVIDTREAYPLVEAYEPDGTHLWTLNIGKNEANDIDVNFLVYDFDGDGKAEVVMRSYDGMTDGQGNVIGDADADVLQSLQKQKDRQYFSEGNEYLSVFDGMSGAEIARTELLPARDPLSSWSDKYSDTSRLTKRAGHFLFGAAYLNGTTPSIVMLRGAWDAVKLAAWDYKDKKLSVLWQYDSGPSEEFDNMFNAGYHSLAVADVDFDGKDEIITGAGAVDDDGSFMYATYVDASMEEGQNKTKLRHGDAFDVAKMDPNFNGYYVWACHENKNLPANVDLHDARTGQVLYGHNKPKDTGRARAADIDPTSPGWEVWGSTGTALMSWDGRLLVNGKADSMQSELKSGQLALLSGETLGDGWNTFKYRLPDGSYQTDKETGKVVTGTLPMNFKASWDGDLLAELVDGTTISEYNYETNDVDIIFEAEGCGSNNGSKAVPCLAADIFGDWRDEIIWRDANNTELRIYATPFETEYRFPTPMHDITYRECIAWQNNHYNQPANTSYYMGAETTSVPMPMIRTTSGKTSPDAGNALSISPNASEGSIIAIYYTDGRLDSVERLGSLDELDTKRTVKAYRIKDLAQVYPAGEMLNAMNEAEQLN